MNQPLPFRTLTVLLTTGVMACGLLLTIAPVNGQVVIDMPPPPAAAEEEKEPRIDTDEHANARPLELEDDGAPAGDDASDAPDADNTNADASPNAKSSSAARTSQHPAVDDVGRLALARYAGARRYARPTDPYRHWGYQPRGRGVGPWGLGNHCSWYGNFHAITPAVFIGGRGEILFR